MSDFGTIYGIAVEYATLKQHPTRRGSSIEREMRALADAVSTPEFIEFLKSILEQSTDRVLVGISVRQAKSEEELNYSIEKNTTGLPLKDSLDAHAVAIEMLIRQAVEEGEAMGVSRDRVLMEIF